MTADNARTTSSTRGSRGKRLSDTFTRIEIPTSQRICSEEEEGLRTLLSTQSARISRSNMSAEEVARAIVDRGRDRAYGSDPEKETSPKDTIERLKISQTRLEALRQKNRDVFRNVGLYARRFADFSMPVFVGLACVTMLAASISLFESSVFAAQGQEALSKGDSDSAYSHFKKSISFNPTNTEAYIACGNISEKKEDLEDAYQKFSEAVLLDPDNLKLLERKGSLAIELEKYRDALACYNKLIAAPGNDKKRFQLGARAVALTKLGKYYDALIDYTRVLKAQPKSEDALLGAAFCYMQLENFDRALKPLDKLLASDHDNAEAHILRGWCFRNLGNLDGAIANLTWVRENAPGNVRGRLYLARLLNEAGSVDEAVAELENVLDLDDNNHEARATLAGIYLDRREYKSAVEQFRRMRSGGNTQENFYTLKALSEAALGAGEYKMAVDALTKIIALRPDIEQYYIDRAGAYASLGNTGAAIRDCSLVIKRNSACAAAYMARASYHRKAGNDLSAVHDLHSVIEIAPQAVDALVALGEISQRCGKDASAVHYFKKALEIEPGNQTAKAGAEECSKKLASMVGQVVLKNASRLTKTEMQEIEAADFETLVSKGYSAFEKDRLSYALKAFSRAVSLRPDSVKARRYLAYAYLSCNMPQKAKLQFDSLRLLGAYSSEDDMRLARSFLRNDLHAQGIGILQAYLAEEPKDAGAIVMLADACVAIGQTERAMDLCSAALKEKWSASQYDRLNACLSRLTERKDADKPVKRMKMSEIPIDARG